jgi:hypothetical protein
MRRPFRVLGLDVGGIMGALHSSALATFERATGVRIVEPFDRNRSLQTPSDRRRDRGPARLAQSASMQ